MCNGRETSKTISYDSKQLIQNKNGMVQQSDSVQHQLPNDVTHVMTACGCGSYHIKYYAALIAVLLCLVQVGSWFFNIGYLGSQYLYVYDAWCTFYTVSFIVAQYSKKPSYIAPILIHFTILPVIAVVGAVLSIVGVIACATIKVLAERNQNPFFRNRNLESIRSDSVSGLFYFSAASLSFFLCCAMFVDIRKHIIKFRTYLLELQKH